MKNHFWYRFAISALIAGATQLSLAGAASSGGGAAVVCRNANNEITSARLLDLFESEVRFGHTVLQSNEDARTILNEVLGRLDEKSNLQLFLKEIVAETIESIKFLPQGVVFASPEDLGQQGIVVSDGCHLQGVGYYEGDTLMVAKSIYNSFSETDKAAFIIHESLYLLARKFMGQTNSSSSRKLTGELFATDISSQEVQNNVIKSLGWRFGPVKPDRFFVVNDQKRKFVDLKFQFEGSAIDPYRVRVRCFHKLDDSRTVFYAEVREAKVVRVPSKLCHHIRVSINSNEPDQAAHPTISIPDVNPAEPESVLLKFHLAVSSAEISVGSLVYRDIVLPALPK